ncbi:hypothetical protein MTR67_039317 [Solanum verrucosum]|uniref:Reverse transcriptase/retrotransposon-derived protein RNase H-like domain-containing protein n=1 Tax=Solanum verrucosum TaxID=315347 RepID=A0AAF0ZNI1_SOLVR|nr:hypothetical protein MTR67_039317 [Solanum verrucosum]
MFEWLEACDKIFQVFKDRLTFAPVSTLPEGTNGFVIYCDSFRVWLGCVLMQNDYDMSFLYHPGKANVVADALSVTPCNLVSLTSEF